MTATVRVNRLDDRYGRTPGRRRRRRVVGIAVAAVVLVAVVAWALWTGIGGAVGTLDTSTLGFVQHARSVTVSWEVDGRPGEALWCDIEAQADDASVVGMKEVLVPVTGSATRTGTTTVRIVRAADTGLINSCRRA